MHKKKHELKGNYLLLQKNNNLKGIFTQNMHEILIFT